MARDEAESPAERDLTAYKDKPATAQQEAFADWLLEEVGVEFGTAKETAAFREGVRLAKALIMTYQKSPASKEVREALRAQRAEEAEARAAARAEREAEKPEPAAKPAKATKTAAAAKSTGPAAKKTTSAPPAKRTRRAATPTAEEAPF